MKNSNITTIAPKKAWLEGGSLVLVSLTCTVAGLYWGHSPAEAARGWPFYDFGFVSETHGGGVAWAFVLAAVALSGLAGRSVWQRGRGRIWCLVSIYFGVIFAYTWFILPGSEIGWTHLLVGLLFLVAAILAAGPSREMLVGLRVKGPPRQYLILDAFLIMAPLGVWLFQRGPIDGGPVLSSLLTYPLYGFVQLMAFLFLPGTLLIRLQFPRPAIVMVCACLFGLAHWPNTLVMLVTFVAMVIWAVAWLMGRPAVVSALLMGIAATTFTQFLPLNWTGHMKVGPGLVLRRAIDDLGSPEDATVSGMQRFTVDPMEYLAKIYPQILEREATGAELAHWKATLRRGLCCATAFRFVTTERYAEIAEERGLPPPPPQGIHWTEAPPAWRDRIAHFGEQSYWESHGSNYDDFYIACWEELCGGKFPHGAKTQISGLLSPAQTRRLLEVLHENRNRWRNTPFAGISDAKLRWHRH